MLILLCFLPCVFDKACLLFCLQTCLLLFLRFQPCLFNKAGLYAPLISAFIPQRFDIPLQTSNAPAPLPQISALPLQPLALNPPPPPSVSLKGQGGPLLLPSVAHAHSPLLRSLRLWQGVPPLLPSNVPAPLAQISALPLQQGGPCLQPSDVSPPPHNSALIFQRDVIPIKPSSVRAAGPPGPPPLSVSFQV